MKNELKMSIFFVILGKVELSMVIWVLSILVLTWLKIRIKKQGCDN